MNTKLSRFFRGFSLRQRFLVAPLLTLVVCSVITAAFVYESRRENAVLGDIMRRNLESFTQYSAVVTNLMAQHMALYELLYDAGNADEETLYEQSKLHLYKVGEAIDVLEKTLRFEQLSPSQSADLTASKNEVRADALARTQAYREGVTAAMRMATANIELAPGQLALADRRFVAMNNSLLKFLEMERNGMSQEFAARVRRNDINRAAIALVGESIAVALLFVSLILGRLLSRSIETQIDVLTELGAQAGARIAVEGSDEVDRMAQAIAAFRQSLLHLRESERRFGDVLQNVALASFMMDREARITYCNEHLLELTGRRRGEVIGRNWFELFMPREAHDEGRRKFADVLAGLHGARHHENQILTRTGEHRLIRWTCSALRSADGEVIGTASIGEDITERRKAEARIAYLNRVYAVLSGINTLIVRVHDRDELFREACRVAVEVGGFRMSWIGIVDRAAMKIVPVAATGGDEKLLAAVNRRFATGATLANTLAAQAMTEKKAAVSNDSENDPKILIGKQYAASGIHSIAMLPLIVADEAVGMLALYANEVEFFHEEELKLLTELAGDISFALDHIDKAEKLDYLAYYDALTGLANRSLFLERVAQHLRGAAGSGRKLSLYMIDLERFRNINDSLGRPAGDALLIQVAQWLTRHFADASLLAKVGADQFAVVLPDAKCDDVMGRVENTMANFMEHPFRLNDAVFRIAAKAGIALFPDHGNNADTLFRNAEAALKQAKAGGERCLFYTQNMTESVAGKLTLENQLRHALDNEEFVLHYQPKVSLASGKLIGAEALIRWNDPRTGLVPPGRFIPVLEETGLINEVGRWALRQAIADYLRWRAAGLAAVRVAVNVSPLQLRNRGFIAEVERALGIDARAAAGLELEITESLIMEDIKHSIASLNAVRAMGVSIAIDDFGTGFSSLAYLSKLPIDTLKIDRSFVNDMNGASQGLALVSTIISLAHALKLKVVAEGVETEEQARLLRLLACDQMQGYLFSKPVAGDIFETRFLVAPQAPVRLLRATVDAEAV